MWRTPTAVWLSANLLKLDKPPAGRGVAFLMAVATPLQIRRLAAHFVQNRPEIGERVRPTHGANWRRSMQPLSFGQSPN
jgi:hypothetical protein